MSKDKRLFIHSLIIPLMFLISCWIVKTWEIVTNMSFVEWGIFPREIKGLAGILFTPFIHGDLSHLTTNSITFFVLATALFYFYREIALKTFLYIYFLSNTLLWFSGRSSWHIGASGVIYGIAAFLVVSGIIRRQIGLVALSFVIIFAYGSMFWHIFPLQVNDPISWEGHLMGALSGLLLALLFRDQGPQKEEWNWIEDDEPENEDDELIFMGEEKIIEKQDLDIKNKNEYTTE